MTATITLHHGNCLDVLAGMPDASVDAVVTDPPYGLANTDPLHVADTIVRWVNGDRDYIPEGAGFMGKAWDAFVPPVAVWDECLRVLKPGGHVLTFAGSRTVDLMTLGLRLAGFEIRDSIAWLYGQGFPKSLDVSKAIDKAANAAPLWDEIRAHIREWRDRAGMTNGDLNAALGTATNGSGMARHWTSEEGGQHSIPSKAMWQRLKALLGWPDCDLDATYDAVKDGAERPAIGVQRGAMSGWSMDGSTRFVDRDVTAPATPDAERWQGWGTALKPGLEPVVVGRKPLTGTVAANVLAYGTGALNIDGCRIETSDNLNGGGYSGELRRKEQYTSTDSAPGAVPLSRLNRGIGEFVQPSGRWPANVILDEDMAGVLDEQSGTRPSSGGAAFEQSGYGGTVGLNRTDRREIGYGDSGASRFFFVASHDKGDTSALTGQGSRIESCETVSTAAESSSQPRQFGGSAPSDAATSGHLDTAPQTGSPSTSATPSGSRPSGRLATPTTPNTGAGSSPEQRPDEHTPTGSRARSAAPSAQTDTTTTTTSPSTSGGSAAPATSSTTPPWRALGDTDSARFRYVAKAPKRERPAVDGTAHPTVKPLALMRWLVRLVTPPGGVVLEPFAGSGATVEACIIEGFHCIAIEREAEYLPLIRHRIDRNQATEPDADTDDGLCLFDI